MEIDGTNPRKSMECLHTRTAMFPGKARCSGLWRMSQSGGPVECGNPARRERSLEQSLAEEVFPVSVLS